MLQTHFQYDNQWCLIHYPKKPNGFAVMLIGDRNYFVDEKGSFWTENNGRARLIERLTEDGYIVFYSNLYGNHWGSQRAVQHAIFLYQFIKRNEIINPRIHLYAEGMGALLASKLAEKMGRSIRSVLFVSPCVSLQSYVEYVRQQKFFYKRLIKELSLAYGVNEKEWANAAEVRENHIEPYCKTSLPYYFLQIVGQNEYHQQTDVIKQIYIERKNRKLPTQFDYCLAEHRSLLLDKWLKFYKENEREL
ncbi:MAG TPA: hypothetical protein VEY51_08825 [Chondromyces sp.]|nr:hypothetical protein [Chondromyces sp.]